MNDFSFICDSGFIGSLLVRVLRQRGILDITIAENIELGWKPAAELETGLQSTNYFATQPAAVQT